MSNKIKSSIKRFTNTDEPIRCWEDLIKFRKLVPDSIKITFNDTKVDSIARAYRNVVFRYGNIEVLLLAKMGKDYYYRRRGEDGDFQFPFSAGKVCHYLMRRIDLIHENCRWDSDKDTRTYFFDLFTESAEWHDPEAKETFSEEAFEDDDRSFDFEDEFLSYI